MVGLSLRSIVAVPISIRGWRLAHRTVNLASIYTEQVRGKLAGLQSVLAG